MPASGLTASSAAVIALLGVTVVAPAQPVEPDPAPAAAAAARDIKPFSQVLADLASTDFAVREGASELLLTGDYPAAELERALTGPELTPEQRERLMRAGAVLWAKQPLGALGISFDETDPMNSVIRETHRGFPAAEVLRAGDRIVGLGGVMLRDLPREGLTRVPVRTLTISFLAGESAQIRVLRGGVEQNLEITMGRFDRLNVVAGMANFGRSNAPSQREVEAGWAFRIARKRAEEKPVVIDLSSARLSPTGRSLSEELELSDGRGAGGLWPTFTPGGRPKDPRRQLEAAISRDPTVLIQTRPGGVEIINRGVLAGPDEEVIRTMMDLNRSLMEASVRAMDPAAPAADRAAARQKMDVIRAELQMLQQKLIKNDQAAPRGR